MVIHSRPKTDETSISDSTWILHYRHFVTDFELDDSGQRYSVVFLGRNRRSKFTSVVSSETGYCVPYESDNGIALGIAWC